MVHTIWILPSLGTAAFMLLFIVTLKQLPYVCVWIQSIYVFERERERLQCSSRPASLITYRRRQMSNLEDNKLCITYASLRAALFHPETLIQKRHPYTGILNSGTLGDSKNHN